MAKSMHYLHMSEINQRFKEAGLGYSLHLNGACESSEGNLRVETGTQDIAKAYEIINEVIAKNALHAEADEQDELHILVY